MYYYIHYENINIKIIFKINNYFRFEMNDFKGIAEEFRLIVEEIERLETKRNILGEKIRYIYRDAKSHGHDISSIRSTVQIRLMRHS